MTVRAACHPSEPFGVRNLRLSTHSGNHCGGRAMQPPADLCGNAAASKLHAANDQHDANGRMAVCFRGPGPSSGRARSSPISANRSNTAPRFIAGAAGMVRDRASLCINFTPNEVGPSHAGPCTAQGQPLSGRPPAGLSISTRCHSAKAMTAFMLVAPLSRRLRRDR
jgi:hypothetical protein